MARISAAEMEKKQKLYDELILKIFLAEGWDAVTYDRISKDMGVTKSSIQRYFPSKMHFATALQGKIFPEAIRLIDVSSKERFFESWERSLRENQIFRESLRIIMTNAIAPVTAQATQNAITRIAHLLAPTIGEEEAKAAVELALGRTLLLYINNEI
ncbi:TetR family transcriptional regulator [Vibrio makurazakiensis]|uniref:TetR/AcrR family transcriptional regulator n=1 Tax=Vibrio makurazakiensis TaxID=2910250 RepID=UPI003D0A6152